MNSNEQNPAEREGVKSADAEVAAEAEQLERNLDLSPETAQLTARDELASGPGKPASRAVDDARAAEARATEADR